MSSYKNGEGVELVPEPRITAFESMAFGMFIHWGLYSLIGEGEWVQHIKPIERSEYVKLKEEFTASEFDARAIARLAKSAGMRYITLTSRHHDGFSLYDTRGLNKYDAPHSAAGRDLVGEFVEGCRAEGIVPFLYHTTLDWHWGDAKTFTLTAERFDEYLDYLLASVKILCTQYGPLGGLWFDGNWSREDMDWKCDRLYTMIRSHQPDAVIIDNTGIHALGQVGHPMIDCVTFEQNRPRPMNRKHHTRYLCSEMCQTLNGHWGIGRCDFAHKSPAELIGTLSTCRGVGSNYLLNVGPTATGAIPALDAEILRTVGRWVAMHEAAFYDARPCGVRCLGKDHVVAAGDKAYYYAHDLSAGGHENVTLAIGGKGARAMTGLSRPIKRVRWMDNGEDLRFTQNCEAGLAAIDLTGFPYGTSLVVRVAEIEFDTAV